MGLVFDWKMAHYVHPFQDTLLWPFGFGKTNSDHMFTVHARPNPAEGVREGVGHFEVRFLEPCRHNIQGRDSEYQWLDTSVLSRLGVKLKTAMNVK